MNESRVDSRELSVKDRTEVRVCRFVDIESIHAAGDMKHFLLIGDNLFLKAFLRPYANIEQISNQLAIVTRGIISRHHKTLKGEILLLSKKTLGSIE